MTTAAAGRDLSSLLDAYALLEVPLTATPADVRHAYRRLARTQHPDRYPAGSPEQQAATSRMAMLNGAYALVQDAPLRYHPISRGTETVFDDTDASVEESIRRARSGRIYRQVAAGLAFAVLAGLALASVLAMFQAMGMSRGASFVVATAFVAAAYTMRRSFDPLVVADTLRTVLRMISAR